MKTQRNRTLCREAERLAKSAVAELVAIDKELANLDPEIAAIQAEIDVHRNTPNNLMFEELHQRIGQVSTRISIAKEKARQVKARHATAWQAIGGRP